MNLASAVKLYWAPLTSAAVAGVVVAKQLGYLSNLGPNETETLMLSVGGLLSVLAARSGMTAQANAQNLATTAATVQNMAAVTTAAAATQAQVLTEASKAVVAAAVANPTPSLIAVAGLAAEAMGAQAEAAPASAQ